MASCKASRSSCGIAAGFSAIAMIRFSSHFSRAAGSRRLATLLEARRRPLRPVLAMLSVIKHIGSAGPGEGRAAVSSRSMRRRASFPLSDARVAAVIVFSSSSDDCPRSTPRATFSEISSMYPRGRHGRMLGTDFLPGSAEPCPGMTRSNSRASKAPAEWRATRRGKLVPMYGSRPCIRSPVAITRSEGI